MTAEDSASGRRTGSPRAPIQSPSSSPALAGRSIFIVDDAGYTHILEPGPRFKELRRNIIENIHPSGQGGNPGRQESFYTSPFFEGNAMYLRGEEYLYCIRKG